MKSLILILFTLLFVSCKKYKLRQPCTLQLENNYFISGINSDEAQYDGFATVSRITFTGEREEGDPVEIEQVFDNMSVSLGQNALLGINFDVPVGVYLDYKLRIRLASENSLELQKEFNDSSIKPIIIHFDEDIDLNFASDGPANELKKNENYTCRLIWNYNSIFNGINNQELASAPTTIINGKETIVISENISAGLFNKIKNNITKTLQLKIE